MERLRRPPQAHIIVHPTQSDFDCMKKQLTRNAEETRLMDCVNRSSSSIKCWQVQMKQFNVIPEVHKYNIVEFDTGRSGIKMLDLSNKTIYTDLEHNACTITLLVIHVTLLLWTLFSCSVVPMMVSQFNFAQNRSIFSLIYCPKFCLFAWYQLPNFASDTTLTE